MPARETVSISERRVRARPAVGHACSEPRPCQGSIMPRARGQEALPPCYAFVHPGLEELAGEEIERDLGGEVKKTGRGYVVFRVAAIDEALLHLRTTEDVFLLAWGTDQLSYRAADLDKIRRWTAREPDWQHLLRVHHAVRPKPKGRHT